MPRSHRSRVLPLLALCCVCVALALPRVAWAEDSGIDPSLALWGSSAVALLFTVGGSLALAQYHRASGAIDGRLVELRSEGQQLRELLAKTREEYARRDETATLRAELRGEMNDLRGEVRALHGEVSSVRADVTKVINILTGERRP